MSNRLCLALSASGLLLGATGPAFASWSPAMSAAVAARSDFVTDGNVVVTLTEAVDNGDPNQCGTATTLTIDLGQALNLCYTLTNHTGRTLNYQSLSDSFDGLLFAQRAQPIADGESFRYNRLIAASAAAGATIAATWSTQDQQPNYIYDATGASRFVDISTTGTPLGLADDGVADVSLPFAFDYYGTAATVLSISNNGGVTVGVPSAPTLPTFDFPLPGAFVGPVMLPLWDDFAATTGNVYYQTLGDEPNRQFVVEWFDRVHFNGAYNTDGATFELIIDETTGTFSFEYADVDYTANTASGTVDCDGGQCGTVGIQLLSSSNGAGSVFTQVSSGTDALTNGESILWSPLPVATYSSSASVSLDVGAAVSVAIPESLSANVAVGGSTVSTLTIENQGNRPLTWAMDEDSSATGSRWHFPAVPFRAEPRAIDRMAASQRSAPQSLAKSRDTAAAPPLPLGASQVPAFGELPGAADLISFDAASPSGVTAIGGEGVLINEFYGGSFAYNDFSKIYLVGPSANVIAPTTSGLVSVDTTTGAITLINPDVTSQTKGVAVTVMRWDPSTGTMYACATDNGPPVNPPPGFQPMAYLYTVDLASGEFASVGSLANVSIGGLAFDAAGDLYGLDIHNDQLIAIDKTDATYEPIGPIGFDANFAQGIDFDPRTGVLWYAACINEGFACAAEMDTIDTATGHATTVGPIGDGAEVVAFSIAEPAGPCANPDDVPWLSISPASGTTDSMSETPTQVAFDAAGLGPGTYSSTICLKSNDLSHRVVSIPVTFVVGDVDDRIFADGFEITAR